MPILFKNGAPSEWHYHHLRNLIETGAGSLVIESTAISREGRITNKDLCLFNKKQMKEHSKLLDYLKNKQYTYNFTNFTFR